MFYLLLPLEFLCVTTDLNEPLSLARSILLVLTVSIFVFIYPHVLKAKYKFMYLLLALPGVYVLSAVANKQNPILALLGNYNRNFGIFTLIGVGLLVLITANSNIKSQAFINYGLWPTTVLAIVYSYMQSFNFDPLTWVETDRTVLTLGNSDYAASFLGILIIVPFYGFFEYKNRLTKASMFPLLWLINNAGLNTQAYQYRVIALVSTVVFILVYFWTKIASLPKVVTVGTLLGFVVFTVIYVLNNKIELVSRTNFEDRISQQKMGLAMFLDHPILGVGIDQMWRFMPTYLKPIDIQKNGSLVIPDKTHNIFIDHLAHGGVIAGLVFIGFIIFSVVIVFKLANKKDAKENRSLAALLTGIWIAYVAQQLISTDAVMLMIMPYMVFGLICKLNFGGHENLKSMKNGITPLTTSLIRSFISIFLISVIIVGWHAIYSDWQVKKILTHQIRSGDIALNVIKSFPNPLTTERIIIDALTNFQNCPFVNIASDQLLKIDNRSGQAWYFKAVCDDAFNHQKRALIQINSALNLQPRNLYYWSAKLRLQVKLGDIVGAKDSLLRIKFINANYDEIPDLESLIESVKQARNS